MSDLKNAKIIDDLQNEKDFYKKWYKEVEVKLDKLRKEQQSILKNKQEAVLKNKIYKNDEKLKEYFKDEIEILDKVNTVNDDTVNKEQEIKDELSAYNLLSNRIRICL